MTKEKPEREHLKALREYGIEDMCTSDLSLLRFRKNEYLLRQGYASDYLLLVLGGRMKVFISSPNGKALLVCFYTKTGILGEAEFAADAYTAAMSVQAITDVICIGIPREQYQEYLKQNAAFMHAVSRALAGKLFRCNKNSAVTILYALESRLCAYIAMTNDKGCFNEKLTEIAEVLGTSYRHLLRTLNGLCSKGVLQKATKGYIVKDQAALIRIGDDYYVE